jgi:hypothetical protein
MDWIAYFDDFFSKRAAKLAEMMKAAGCREGWVQGELFLHGRDLGIETNATRLKYDILCKSAPMIAEIKICGGDYSPKMKGLIEDDVRKLGRDPGDRERFMILIVDTRKADSKLADWLRDPGFSDLKLDRKFSESVAIKVWQVKTGAQQQ